MKPKYRFDIKQNTEEWYDIKLGKFSDSSCAELLMDKKCKGYINLINKIVEERITGQKCESKTFQGNTFTERGHELELVAREDYEFRTFNSVDIIGVVELDDWVLCSPDGLIGEDGLYQAKCPIFNTQMEYLKTKKIPSNYYKQLQFELYVTGRKYSVFNSYHPHLPAFDEKVYRDEKVIDEIKKRIDESKEEVTEMIDYINSL